MQLTLGRFQIIDGIIKKKRVLAWFISTLMLQVKLLRGSFGFMFFSLEISYFFFFILERGVSPYLENVNVDQNDWCIFNKSPDNTVYIYIICVIPVSLILFFDIQICCSSFFLLFRSIRMIMTSSFLQTESPQKDFQLYFRLRNLNDMSINGTTG